MSGIHAFVICAYKKSPYLESCIRSLMRQTVKSDVIMVTATPSQYLSKLCKAYKIPLFIREGEPEIGEDWLFGWKQAGKDHSLVTIAHQDDIYHKNYVKELLKQYKAHPDMTVFCTDYLILQTKEEQMADGTLYPVHTEIVSGDKGRFIKKILRFPLRFSFLAHKEWVKKSVLLFGNPICCPSCTYNHDRIGDVMFRSEFTFALDWDNLYELARRPGRFICVERPLMAYRIHDGATTKQCIGDNRRAADEIAMFEKLWPRWMVKLLMHFYKGAYKAYGEEE